MQIKHKIILWFSSLLAGSLLVFSVYVYFTYAALRQRAMEGWLERKARVTEQLLTTKGEVVGKVTTSMAEQAILLYTPADSLLLETVTGADFAPDTRFRETVRKKRFLPFSYPSPRHDYPKEGMALTYPGPAPSPDGKEYLVVVTAYDQEGYIRQKNLRDLLLIGNAVALTFVGLLGYFFSKQALKPLHHLIDQLQTSPAGPAPFRLRPDNPGDEVGVLAAAFNDLLVRQEKLIENQRSFISQASHELRTPLTTIKGWLETSLTYDSDAAGLRKGMAQAIRELDRLTGLSNGLLQLAQIDGVTAGLHPLDLTEVLLDAADTFGEQRPGQVLSVSFGDELTRNGNALLVDGNASLLKIALANLLDNAAKYSGGQAIDLAADLESPERVTVVVKDRGIGLKPGEEEQVLLPLVRGSNAGTISGFGIGLTLTHRIVQLHKGHFTLRARVGGGTEAVLSLPLLPPSNAI